MQDQVRKMSAVIYVESGKNTAICFIGLLNLCIFSINTCIPGCTMRHKFLSLNQSPDYLRTFDNTSLLRQVVYGVLWTRHCECINSSSQQP